MRIHTESITNWNTAKKVQSVKAKPLVSLMVDRSVMSKFLLDTLEGNETLGDGAVVCIGGAGDAWQQMPKKLLAKYDVKSIDVDGWMVCEPRPENSINVIEVTREMVVTAQLAVDPTLMRDMIDNKFYLIGHFGQQAEDGLRQFGEVGDFIGQNREDPSDVWVIRRKIFLNTYNLTS